MKKEKEITLKDALTYGDDSGDSSLDVDHDNNSNGEVKEETPTPLQIINAYLGVILSKLISSERLMLATVILSVANFFILLGIVIFK